MSKWTLRPRAVAAAALALLSLGAAALSYADSGPQSLVDLIRSGQRDAVLAAITSPSVDVNTAAPDGSTPLMWAVYNVDHEMVRALLKRGAKANVVNRYGDSALTEAVKVGDVGLVRMLLEAGANADSPNQDGETALMLASSIGSLPIAQMLIKRGAHVNAVETFLGQTALMWAAAENHPEVVDLLIKHGAAAEINRRGKYDDWPRQMTSEPRAQFRQTGGLTALLYATRSGCLRCAVAIVKAGADVNQPNPDGITPLINAIDNRAYDIAMFLLDKGANPGAWDMSGRTPLSVAVYMHSYRRSASEKPFFTGAGWVAVSKRPPSKATAMDVVNRLLKMGVDVNHQLTRMRNNGRGRFTDSMMRGGTTPLMIATLSYDDVAIKALLAHGAAVNVPNVFRITPLMAAAGMSGSSRGGVGSAIAVGRGGVPTRVDPQTHVIETIDLLLKAGANVNARVTDSHTHTAQLAAYVTGRDHEGQTALFAAAEEGWDRVVKVLLDYGADPQVRDDTNKTALDYARHLPRVFRGPAAARHPSRSEAESRARTVALLTAALLQKRTGAGETASAR